MIIIRPTHKAGNRIFCWKNAAFNKLTIEKQNKENNTSQKHLYVYDKAVTDYVWWDRQKRHSNHMISMLKENSVATLVESIPFDSLHEINTGVEAYSVYENKGIKFNVVDYRDPETRILHRFL